MPTNEQVIDLGIELFEKNPKHWIKNAGAKTADGKPTYPGKDDVAQVCLTGLCKHASSTPYQADYLIGLIKRFLPNNYRSVPEFNDAKKTTVEDVVHVLKSVKLHLKHSH